MATTRKSTAKKPTTRSKATAAKTPKTTKATTRKKSAVSAKTTKKTTSKKVTPAKRSTKVTTAKKVKTSKSWFAELRKWNLFMAFLHAAQGVAIIILAQTRLFPVTTNYLTNDALAPVGQQPSLVSGTRVLFDINIAYLIAAFFFMSAIAHLIIATVYRRRYEVNLEQGVNKARWIEYSVSASTMIVAIAMIAGIHDLSTLLMIFGLTAVMNLCGLVMELHNKGKVKQSVDWSAFIVGCIAGIIPWVVYSFYIVGSVVYGDAAPPTFVYAILISIFLLFNSFALNMWLQYKGKGRWADYIFGEKVYIILSLVAKSALAWQVFAGTLRP